MPANSDVLELVVRSKFGSSPDVMLNVFHYRVAGLELPFGLDIGGDDFMNEWFAQFSPVWQTVISSTVTLTGMTINNLTNTNEFFNGDLAVPIGGIQAADCLPSFNAWGFQLTRFTRATRNGQKRFMGVPEVLQSNGIAIGTAPADLVLLADFLGAAVPMTFPAPSTIDFELLPLIVRKTGLLTFSVTNQVSGALYKRITTQTTRKLGSGS